MKKILLGLGLLATLWFCGRALVLTLISDETKIRWLLEDMEEGYNAGSPGRCISALAEDWTHESSSIDRRMLAASLFQAARDRERETKQLRSRVAVDPEAMSITVDGDSATVSAAAVFSRLRAGEWQETWTLHAEAELVDGDDGWEIVHSRHVDERGTHLGR